MSMRKSNVPIDCAVYNLLLEGDTVVATVLFQPLYAMNGLPEETVRDREDIGLVDDCD